MQYPQNSNGIHHKDWKINPKVHLEIKKTANNQSNTEQIVQCWRYHNTQLKTILQRSSKKKNHGSATKQTLKPVKQNRRPKYEYMYLRPPDFWQKCPKHRIVKLQSLQQMLLEKLDYLSAENWN
jgi:hypothetical protein